MLECIYRPWSNYMHFMMHFVHSWILYYMRLWRGDDELISTTDLLLEKRFPIKPVKNSDYLIISIINRKVFKFFINLGGE